MTILLLKTPFLIDNFMVNDPQNETLRVVLPPRRRAPSQDVSLETPLQDLGSPSEISEDQTQTTENDQPVSALPTKPHTPPRLAYRPQSRIAASSPRSVPSISSALESPVSPTHPPELGDESAGLLEEHTPETFASFSPEEDLLSSGHEGWQKKAKRNDVTLLTI